jgi:predicted DNA-binding transcriptional regulator AlpA
MATSQNASAGEGVAGPERAQAEPSLLIDVLDVAAMLQCSSRHVWRLADAGRMPRPFKLGALSRWDRAAILRWVEQGCPTCRTGGGR